MSQWVQTAGPFGGDVRAFAVLGDKLFAGTNGCIYASSDKGLHWTKVSSSRYLYEVNAFAVMGSTLYVATQFDGIFSTSDNGTTWLYVGDNMGSIQSLGVCGSNILAGSSGYGLYITTDKGANWAETGKELLDKATINCITVSGATVWVGSDRGLFRSIDSGISWEPISKLTRNISALYTAGSDIYAATYDGVFLSTDNGANWTLSNVGLKGTVYAFMASDSSLYAAGNGGVYVTTNKGTSWKSIDSGLFNKYVQAITKIDSVLFVGTFFGDGIYKTTINKENWTVANNGLISTRINCLASSGTNFYAGTERSGMSHTANEGTNWATHYYGSPISEVYKLKALDSNLYLGTSNGEVFLTSDNGISWELISKGLKTGSITNLDVSGSTIITNGYLTKDNGANWTKITTGFPGYINDYCISGDSIYAATSEGVLFSSDLGTTWNSISEGLPKDGFKKIIVSGSHLLCGTDGNGVFLSSDNGKSWESVNNDGLKKYKQVFDMTVSGSHLFVIAGGLIFYSSNNGTNWTSIDKGIEDEWASNIFVGGENIYVGTYFGGVWKRPLSEVATSVDLPPNYIYESALLQSYPNPTREECTIEYTVTKSGIVTVEVFDAMSNKISVLVNATMQAGTYKTMLNTATLANGVYYLGLSLSFRQLL